jgi:tRNA dimethylallyltransferase
MAIPSTPILIIYGPTGVGKSSFAQTVAQVIPSEIINMDMGQLYTPLTIGTAKPLWRSEKTVHHLFDIVDEPRHYTVIEYRARVEELIKTIAEKGLLPIIVGGSGFYGKSLFFPPLSLPLQKHGARNPGIAQELWDQLYAIDPQRAAMLHKHDQYRIARALDIWYTTGKKPSECNPVYTPLTTRGTVLYLTRERADLYERIDQRVDAMIHEGWRAEVERLQATAWEPFLYEKKIIGYDDILRFLQTPPTARDWEHTVALIKQKSRNYAKRQATWWKGMARQLNRIGSTHQSSAGYDIQELNLTFADVELYIKQLSCQFMKE